jgi:hypothetical protein
VVAIVEQNTIVCTLDRVQVVGGDDVVKLANAETLVPCVDVTYFEDSVITSASEYLLIKNGEQ